MLERWDDPLLLLPGPVMLPEATVRALARQVIPHRGPEFARLQSSVLHALRRLLDAPEGRNGDGFEVAVFPGSGTGMLEAAVVHVVEPGDRILACVGGTFGRRFASIAEGFGARVDRIPASPGGVPDPDDVAYALGRPSRPYRALLVTHCETSTGALSDLAALAQAARHASPQTLILVDTVSSLGGTPVRMAAWGLDVVASASQKALVAPPGLGILACSPRALERAAVCRTPRVYWDILAYRERRQAGFPPYTPALHLLFALEASLAGLEADGPDAVYARHMGLRDRFRAGVRRLGLEPLAADACASPTVTAVPLGEGRSAHALVRRLREEHRIVVASGMEELADCVIRVGHMGAVEHGHVDRLLDALSVLL